LLNNAKNCGLNSLIYKTKNEIKHEEPAISAIAGIFSPNTAVFNAHSLMDYYYARGKTAGVEYSFAVEPVSITKRHDGYLIEVRDTDQDTFQFVSEIVINAAGLGSDTIAQMAGINIKEAGYELHYCKGDYFLVQGEKRKMIKHLVYPVPQPKLKGLGIHITLDISGNMHLGPDAEYIDRDNVNYDVSNQKQEAFWHSVNKFFPALDIGAVQPERSGIRPKLQGPSDDVRDFVIREEADKGLPGFINLIGIESPGLTAAPAIGKYVKGLL
ncbi:MAG: FAD-dependent oxidoreductase, partial [Candidatus Margulisiibacteriota bacterium]